MSNILKRIGGVLIVIISAVVLLASVGGVIGLWAGQGAMHDLTAAIFAPVDSGLDTATEALDRVNTRVITATTRVSNAQQFFGELGSNVQLNGAVLGSISDTVSARLGADIDETHESVRNALNLVNGVNSAIVTVNRLPGVDLPTLTDELQSLDARITSLEGRLQELRTDLEQIVQGRLQMTGARVNALLDDINNKLQDVQATTTKYKVKVQDSQARIATLKDNVDTWITIGWIVGTIFLLWIAISQVLMIRYGWSLVARKREQVALAAAPTTPAEDLPSATV